MRSPAPAGWIAPAAAVIASALIVLFPLHDTATPRYFLLAALIGLAAAAGGRAAWSAIPARWLVVALLAWSLATSLWSPDPRHSFGEWRPDLMAPVLAYLAGAALVATGGLDPDRTLRVAVPLSSLALGALSLYAFEAVRGVLPAVPLYPKHGLVLTMPRAYLGVGYAAALATLLLPFALWFAVHERRPLRRLVHVLGVLGLVLTFVAARNRASLLMLPLLMLAMAWVFLRIAGPRRSGSDDRGRGRLRAGIVALVLVMAFAAFATHVTRIKVETTRGLSPGDSAAVVLARDPRLPIWRLYASHLPSVWLAGAGFGRGTPAAAFGLIGRRDIKAIDDFADSHAHNWLFDVLLQTGIVGLVLTVAVLGGFVRRGWRIAGSGRVPVAGLGAAGIGMVIAMLLKNTTDDYMVHAPATAFWLLAALSVTPGPSPAANGGDTDA